jgi:integrase
LKAVCRCKFRDFWNITYKWLKKRKYIKQNPWLDVDSISVPKEQKSRTVTPPPDIVPRLLNAKYEHRYEFPIKEFVYGLYRTGARKEELLFIELDDVDWTTGKWTIQPKRCPTKFGMSWSPKYGNSRLTILPPDVLQMLAPLRRRAMEHEVIGYTPDEDGKPIIAGAGFIFTAKDRTLSTPEKPVYKRVDCIRGAWGGLFVAAGLAEPKASSSQSTTKYKNGVKTRKDFSVPYTRHDMRRAFNVAAKQAGMSIDDRCTILGHGVTVNKEHYNGMPMEPRPHRQGCKFFSV